MITFSRLGKFGRLGNQLFQVAATIGIAKNNGLTYGFPDWQYSSCFKGDWLYTPHIGRGFVELIEQSYKYQELTLDKNTSYDLVGYFQSWKYFEHCKNDILTQFSFDNTPTEGVAVHVRRGDYVNLQHRHPLLTLENYYLKAMNYFSGETFTIFSDDLGWCRSNFPESPYIKYHTTGSPIYDFKCMASFNKFIIANSSFSWWTAYLSQSKNVIAPINYVVGEDTDDRIPPDWKKM